MSTLAVVALIAAQVVVINHDLTGSHTPDSVCEFCVAGAGLSGANVSAAVAPILVNISLFIPDAVHCVRCTDPLRYHFARAPPAAS